MPRSLRNLSVVVVIAVLAVAVPSLAGPAVAYAAPSPSPSPSPSPPPCADPMVMTFDTTLDAGTNGRVGFALTGGSGTVTVDWGGAGTASPVGTGAASDQVQAYPSSPGLIQFNYGSPGVYTVQVCGTVQGFHSPQATGGVAFTTLTGVVAFGSLGVTDYTDAFLGATHLTSVPATLPAGVTAVQGMFQDATRFDADIGRWDTSSVTTMSGMLDHDAAFDRNLGGWNVAAVTDMSAMLSGVTLSTPNYDALLAGWAAQHVRSGVTFDAGSSRYSPVGAAARATLTGTFGWSITDAGPAAAATVSGAVPTIAGTLEVGHTLTADPGTWTPSGVTLAYQWYRSGTAIGGATASRLTLGSAEAGATISVRVTGTLSGSTPVSHLSASTPQVVGATTDAGSFVSVAPTRVLDTRTGTGAPGPVGSYATLHVQVLGRGGVPAAGVSAVVLNLTETGATGSGYLTVHPDGSSRPTASNLNYPVGDTRANLVVVRPGANGGIAVTNSGSGHVQVIADVAGYYLDGAPNATGAFVSLDPTRVLDTRTGNGVQGPVAANGTIRVQIAGRGGVPDTGVSAVVINLTETDARLGGYATVYPDGLPRPTASNLNYPAGDTRANLVTVKLGVDGRIAVASSNGSTVQFVGDVAGYYLGAGGAAAGTFTPLSPTRILDTRSALGAAGPVAAHGTIRLQVAGRGGVPADGVSAVALNLTETEPQRGGFLTAYPDGMCEPGASNLNFPTGDTRANLVVVQLGADGKIALTSHSSGSVQLVADVAGYFTPNTIPAVTPSFRTLAQAAVSAKGADAGAQLGAASGALVIDGCTARQSYANGQVVYANVTGAHALYGPVYARYQALGGYATTGSPVTDAAALADYPGATFARFTGGALIASDHGVRWMGPDIAATYFAHGAAGTFGVPMADTRPGGTTVADDTETGLAMAGQTVASSMLYHRASGGTYWVHGAIYGTWSSMNFADGPLGPPRSNEFTDGVRMQRFATGAIMRGTSGWPAVYGDVWRVYSSATHHAATGDLGLPTGAGGYWVQDFQNARIDHGAIRVKVDASTHTTTSAEVRYTFHSGCPVGPSSLRTISMNYLGFDDRVHRGVMIVRSDLVGEIIDSFSAAGWGSFQIRQMVNPNHWLGDDYKMMAADNTSAFNCRKVSGNPYALSPHSYGTAVDINDFENPYEELGVWYPYKNWYATHRDAGKPGVLVSSSILTSKLVGHGFFWGANWSQPDYQHFQK